MADAITEGCIQQLYAKGLRFETELKYRWRWEIGVCATHGSCVKTGIPHAPAY